MIAASTSGKGTKPNLNLYPMMGNVDVHLVRARTDDQEFRIYAVAAARQDALDTVLKNVPEG